MDFAAIARAFADTAMTALWQSTALALGLAVCLRLAPRTSAGDRFRIWMAGFAAVVVLPFLPGIDGVVRSLFAATGAALTSSAAPVSAAHPWVEFGAGWSFAIAGVWLAASLARAVDLAVHTVRLRGLWKRAVVVEGCGAGQETRATAGREAGGTFGAEVSGTAFEVCTTRELDRPSVIGFFRPRILIPEWLMERLTAAELEQIVLHEAEHLRRRDDWTNLLQKLCLVVFPLNPALVWMERRLCREREMACDEGVVRRTESPRAYAACLTSIAERGLERRAEALSLGAWQRRPELVERVHRILRRGPGLSPAAARALLGAVACGLIVGAAEFARCPQLVEFAAPEMQASAVPESVAGVPMAGYRAVNAVAHVPTRAELAEMRAEARGAAWSRGRVTEKTAGARQRTTADRIRQVQGRVSTRPLGELARNDRTRVSAEEAAAPQEMIVFTTWEQVETTGWAAPLADGASAEKSSQAQSGSDEALSAEAAPQVTRRYTVTRLILRVYPAGAAKAGAGAKPTAKSTGANSIRANSLGTNYPGLPAAVPLRDGWLVLQL